VTARHARTPVDHGKAVHEVMARFLFYTTLGNGHLYPIVPTMRLLRERGHDVVVHTERANLATLAGLGIEAHAVHAGIEARADDTWRSRSPIGTLRRSVAMYLDRALLEADDIRKALRSDRPDAVAVDSNCWGAAAAVGATGVPWAQVAPFLLPLTTPDAPPFGLGLRPARGWPGRARDVILRTSALPLFDRMLPPINRLRTGFGVPAVKHVPDLYMQAPLVLCYTAPPVEYPRTHLPPSVHLVGPGNWDPEDQPSPPWLAGLADPLVLVTASGVYQDDAVLVQTALDALATEPVTVVATTAAQDPDRFRVPANAVVRRFVPHRLLLSRAVAVVCHAGMGITQKALLAGVPLCVVPFGRDQREVARRVVVAGAGVRLAAGRLSPHRLRAAVTAATAHRPGALAASKALAAAGGAPAAATALERLLSTRQPAH
jgi:MGT family glycosyltransferase